MYDYDLLVIGSGPGGQKAAIAGAKLDRRTAIVEKKHMVGGVKPRCPTMWQVGWKASRVWAGSG